MVWCFGYRTRNLFFIFCQKLIMIRENSRSKGNSNSIGKGSEGKRRKQLESRIGMNYSRHLLGSSHPIDRFLSYFKDDAILHEEKSRGISRLVFQLQLLELRRSNEKRSKFYFIPIPNDRSLLSNFFFTISCTILFFPGIFFMDLKKII